MSFEMALSLNGYHCRVVATGEEALAAIAEQPPDGVIMDIHLAGHLDGVECAQRMRIKHNIPIIFITGYNSQEIKIRSQTLQNCYYLEKPMTVHDLLRTLAQVTSQTAADS